jgi:AraC-like DNA-binding protein
MTTLHSYPLDEALHYLRMSGTFYCTAAWSAPWAVALPQTGGEARFHVITHGQAFLKGPGIESRHLKRGDLVLLPQGAGHELAGDPATPVTPIDAVHSEFISDSYAHFRHGEGKDTQLVCVKARFSDPTAQRLIGLLPNIIHVPAEHSRTLESIERTVRFIADEAQAMRAGGETIITRLADVLLVQAIRWWIEHEPNARIGWLGALRDRQIGRVIMLIHRQPARAWTVNTLATEVAMSRSLLAARFKELVGEPVMGYITRWRMHLALTSLREEKVDIGQLAEKLGYQSESAFSRAFKRYVGKPPGAVRASAGGPA